MSFRSGFAALVLGAALALTGCQSAEEKAEEHFSSAMELLEAGDIPRAKIELRNVFKLNGQHHDARATYARILRKEGAIGESYSQYLRLVEQYPEDLEGRRALAEMAIRRQDWEEAARHSRAALAVAPEDPQLIAMVAVVDYVEARRSNDAAAAEAAIETARGLLDDVAAAPFARLVVIEGMVQEKRWNAVIEEVDRGLETDPDNMVLHQAKLSALAALQDDAGIGEHLKLMAERFPDNQQISGALISWYIRAGDNEGAETYLRSLADAAKPEDVQQARITVVQFLHDARGVDAAQEELERLIALDDDSAPVYRALRAAMIFEAGDAGTAIAEMVDILDGAPSGSQTNNLKMALAEMLQANGDPVGARSRAEEVLADDPGHVAALQMKAGWEIADDRPGDAIATLRAALDQDPRNAKTLTLMAEAHLRDGSRELAGERLALAVEVSGQGAAESLRYARFLMADGRLPTAEAVLVAALRQAPAEVSLLAALGEIYLRQQSWQQMEAVIKQLDDLDNEASRQVANGLRAALLAGQEKLDDSAALIEELIGTGNSSTAAATAVVRAYMKQGDIDKAVAYVESLLAEQPDDPQLRMLRAGLHLLKGEVEDAEAGYRALIADMPGEAGPVTGLYTVLRASGRDDEADEVLNAGIEASGGTARLLFIKAGRLEALADYDGAIAIYEQLYERDSSNDVIANNLASLITTHRDDAENLERAAIIARRLRETKVPQFQDTYGWIESRRGNYETALPYLESAAEALDGDPFVHLHLGLTYAALDRDDEAKLHLERALELAGDSNLPQFTKAKAELERIAAAEN
ncbi:tetratricopeptide repeat protein [Frigidibacter sp. ROC022]|uniref:tetratricopeptide repeat protein n=1 Tax=Frigidibacter sp. ROC022 TaxID=2971796 RepID=UPI00215A7E48|nr:tetratricopeptide repeat protein [Frigidibacter sp. ROC022]MCR8726770.1 tetratricopeptide repeat protein [Frigidibacter sp. ROC022]